MLTDDVDFFRGLRTSQLTYNSRNPQSATMISTDGAMKAFRISGVSIIERMNKVGMAIDVSRCGDRTTLDAFRDFQKSPC